MHAVPARPLEPCGRNSGLRSTGIQVAGDEVVGGRLAQLRIDLVAGLKPTRAARVELAMGGRMDRARDIALERDALALQVWVGDGDGGKQCLRVRMRWLCRRSASAPAISMILTEVHDRDPVARCDGRAEIVGDEEVREPQPAFRSAGADSRPEPGSTGRARETGSSETRNCGPTARARAITMRCRCPPEKA